MKLGRSHNVTALTICQSNENIHADADERQNMQDHNLADTDSERTSSLLTTAQSS
ncbi:MAG: hypothetical protein NZ875_09015 [Pseudothermotoga sp.]|nr:hypothetical protein [Pseudothermotoga sp.]MDW8140533.1 hypothetical protein [Pseudothermotoga sp.]